MKYPPSNLPQLPPRLRKAVENRLSKPGFNSYEKLAKWLRDRGLALSVSSLRRYRKGLTQRPASNRSAKVQKQKPGRPTTKPGAKRSKLSRFANRQKTPIAQSPSADADATTEGLMRLTQKKLCSLLAEPGKLQESDMPRLAHAVAHLTQADVSFQRWTVQFAERAGEHGRGESVSSTFRQGLSPDTSEGLRNALLGIAPFDRQERITLPTNCSEDRGDSLAPPLIAGEVRPAEDKGDPH